MDYIHTFKRLREYEFIIGELYLNLHQTISSKCLYGSDRTNNI